MPRIAIHVGPRREGTSAGPAVGWLWKAIGTIVITVIGGVLVEIVKDRFISRQQPQEHSAQPIQKAAPHLPETKGVAAAQSSVQIGRFRVERTQSFSFSLGKPTTGASDVYFAGGYLHSHGAYDLGPVNIESVREVPAHVHFLPSAFGGDMNIFSKYDGYQRYRIGHSYAVVLGNNGPFALVQVTKVEFGDDQSFKAVECNYRFQPNGTRFF